MAKGNVTWNTIQTREWLRTHMQS